MDEHTERLGLERTRHIARPGLDRVVLILGTHVVENATQRLPVAIKISRSAGSSVIANPSVTSCCSTAGARARPERLPRRPASTVASTVSGTRIDHVGEVATAQPDAPVALECNLKHLGVAARHHQGDGLDRVQPGLLEREHRVRARANGIAIECGETCVVLRCSSEELQHRVRSSLISSGPPDVEEQAWNRLGEHASNTDVCVTQQPIDETHRRSIMVATECRS